MGILRDRLVTGPGSMSLAAGGMSVSEILDRLEAGESLAGKTGGVTPADLIAAAAACVLGDDQSLGPGLVQEKPRRPRLARALSEPALASMFPSVSHAKRLALAAGLLQVHNFWDASHDAAQQADDRGERATSGYWHGIAHRREPDASNAAYWFRRVGRHPVFVPLAEGVRPYFAEEGLPALESDLMPGGEWNASAMTGLCAAARADTPQERLARRIQRLEMWLLLEATFAAI
jgi:hypothetical protein